jgi:hypothetical protein
MLIGHEGAHAFSVSIFGGVEHLQRCAPLPRDRSVVTSRCKPHLRLPAGTRERVGGGLPRRTR